MITPESYLPITPSANPSDNEHTTIIHSHSIHAFVYSNSTNSFTKLPYNTDIRGSNLFGKAPEEQKAYNANVPVSPSPTDITNNDNSKGYNWILIGNINPITYNQTTGTLSPGTTGAIFYKGNISTESFRLTKQGLNELSQNTTIQVASKIISNGLNKSL